MTIYITTTKKQTLNFNFAQDLSTQTGTFYLKDGSTTVFSQELTAIDASAGTFKLDLTSVTSDEDLGIYSYICDFSVAGEVDTGTVYLIENETKRIDEIKQTYGLVFDISMMTKAFRNAKKKLIDYYYADGSDIIYSTYENSIEIDNYVADNKNYGFVCNDSIRVYEFTTTPPFTLTELNNNIDNIQFNYPTGKTIVTMDGEYPTDEKSLKIEYKKTIEDFSNVYDTVKYVQELLTYLYLLDHVEINKLQLGFTTKEINGVSFTYDKESIDDLKIKIRQWIDNEATIFEEIIIKNVTFSNDY